MNTPELPQENPIVRLEHPTEVYRAALTSLPNLYRPEDPGFTTESGLQFKDEEEARDHLLKVIQLSSCYLGEDLISDTDTKLVVSWNSKNSSPKANIFTALFLGRDETKSPSGGFYRVARVAKVLEYMKQALPKATLFEDRNSLQIRVPIASDVIIILDFGPSNPQQLIESASGLVGAIISTLSDEEKGKISSNIKLSISMTNKDQARPLGGVVAGGFDIENEENFVNKLRAFEKVYDAFLKALYREKGLPLPEIGIVLKMT